MHSKTLNLFEVQGKKNIAFLYSFSSSIIETNSKLICVVFAYSLHLWREKHGLQILEVLLTWHAAITAVKIMTNLSNACLNTVVDQFEVCKKAIIDYWNIIRSDVHVLNQQRGSKGEAKKVVLFPGIV